VYSTSTYMVGCSLYVRIMNWRGRESVPFRPHAPPSCCRVLYSLRGYRLYASSTPYRSSIYGTVDKNVKRYFFFFYGGIVYLKGGDNELQAKGKR
jgi:hypothetical protein